MSLYRIIQSLFQKFYERLIYSSKGIDLSEIEPHIAFILFMMAIACTVLLWALRGKLSLKTIVEGVLMAGYIFFAMLWSLCLYDCKLAVELFPIYPPIVILLFKKIVIRIAVRFRQR